MTMYWLNNGTHYRQDCRVATGFLTPLFWTATNRSICLQPHTIAMSATIADGRVSRTGWRLALDERGMRRLAVREFL
ncbi:hypothetical protein ACVWZZ_003838 [Bradyrhizobium sp. LM6.10]